MCGQAPQTSVLHLSSIQTPAVEHPPWAIQKFHLGSVMDGWMDGLLGGCWGLLGVCWGLLGVAGMMTLLVMTGIIPENSLRKNAPVSKFLAMLQKPDVTFEYMGISQKPWYLVKPQVHSWDLWMFHPHWKCIYRFRPIPTFHATFDFFGAVPSNPYFGFGARRSVTANIIRRPRIGEVVFRTSSRSRATISI